MYEQFVEEVMRRAGIGAHEQAERAIAETLGILGQRLRDVDARAVAAQLPAPLAHMLVAASTEPRNNSSTTVDMALTRAVCRVLAETLDEQGRTHLRMQPLSALFC